MQQQNTRLFSKLCSLLFLLFAYTATLQAQTTLTDLDKQVSDRFKLLNGQNRESIFVDSLYKLIRVNNSSNNDLTTSNLMSSKVSTRSDVRMLLGTPTLSIPDFFDEWNLLANPATKKVVVIYDKDDKVVSWAIKN